MAREMNKNNTLHNQDLGLIVIFQHHQEQHFKHPYITFQEHIFSLCCNMDTIRRLQELFMGHSPLTMIGGGNLRGMPQRQFLRLEVHEQGIEPAHWTFVCDLLHLTENMECIRMLLSLETYPQTWLREETQSLGMKGILQTYRAKKNTLNKHT